jgi:hypothetical protein
MPYIVKTGTIAVSNLKEGEPIPADHVLAPVPLPDEPHIWDTDNIRTMNAADDLAAAITEKRRQLQMEAASRLIPLDRDFASRTELAQLYKDVHAAGRAAYTAIGLLTDIVDVRLFNVVTDPVWP